MSRSNFTCRSNKCPNQSINKEEYKEDALEGSEVEEEDLVEVVNQSSVTPVGYLGIIRGSALMRSVHTVQPAIIMLKDSLS